MVMEHLCKPPTPPFTTGTPVQVERRQVSSAVLSGHLDFANSLHKAFSLEFSGSGLDEVQGVALMDTGAECDLVTSSLVASLESQNLCARFPIEPFSLGAVDRLDACQVTHAANLPLRLGESFSEWDFAIADLPSPPHIILGLPWMRKHCPEVLHFLEKFGPTIIHTDGSWTPYTKAVHTPAISPLSTTPKPQALSPSTNTAAAFSAGGVFAAVEAEIHRRQEATEKARSVMIAQIRVCQAIQDKQDDPGVRGLTGNQEGWLDTIPEAFRKYADTVFSDASAARLPPLRPGTDCEIRIKDGSVLKTSKIYDMSQEQLTTLKALLDAELAKGFIRPSQSGSSAPVFFVRDPPSESRNQGQLRLVVDYRDLNQKIELDEFPIPLSRTIMSRLPRAKIFTKFDVRSGFANIRMKPGSEPATAFKTFFGLFEYQVMPMGLATAPSVFQRFINSVLAPYLDLFCFAYLDDIIIFSDSVEEHQKHVDLILQALRDNELHLKPSKCSWFQDTVSFLGFTVVAGRGIRMSDDKIQGIRASPVPRGLSDLRSFLGLVNFYDKFIPHYSDIVSPLTDLTKKDSPWNWTDRCQEAFDRLLSAIRNDVFLAAFNPDLPCTLETDSSDVAYAGVISQPGPDGSLRPLIFFHHKFKDHEKGWDAADKELYAIIFAFDRYRHFLAQPKFPVEVFSDHRNLAKFMFSSDLLKSHDGRLARWWEKLALSNFTIHYRTGESNVVADFLSRYGYEDSAALDAKSLLPASRFSAKALADIETWFKTSATTPNIRQKLERAFAKSEKQIGSAHPVVPSHPVKVASVAMRPLFRLISRLTGPSLESLSPPHHLLRFGKDRRGLG